MNQFSIMREAVEYAREYTDPGVDAHVQQGQAGYHTFGQSQLVLFQQLLQSGGVTGKDREAGELAGQSIRQYLIFLYHQQAFWIDTPVEQCRGDRAGAGAKLNGESIHTVDLSGHGLGQAVAAGEECADLARVAHPGRDKIRFCFH